VKASNDRWRAALAGEVPADLAEEIDVFESEIALRKQNRIEERVFAETRLRRGVYGQRYDNGHRHDGRTERTLDYPSGELTKGPDTAWDAPGMQRIKIPYGGMNARQLEVMADLAEEYSDGIAHVTTRQDFQLHFMHVDDTPALMRRLAAVGITTREACGNSVRNVTACPIAGVCHDEVFDVTPYANACAQFLLGHPDVQDFGRKFKIAFSGCKDQPCGLVMMHDMGAIATERTRDDGTVERGFELYVGGGLGSVPFQAKLFDGFVPPEELLPLSQAISRVYARLGEKKNRAAARIKFLIKKLGIDEFRRLVLEERAKLPDDPRWLEYIEEAKRFSERPLKAGAPTNGVQPPAGFAAWRDSNAYPQRQPGYATVTITLPLGDITARQLRKLADIARTYVRETVRTTVEQNMVLRWVSEADLPALYRELAEVDLHAPGAGTIVDITACPGTDTCKLGIASSRGLAGELRERLLAKSHELDQVIRGLRIKVSGCFNSCGQHHVADLGFYGVSRKRNKITVPHFQVVLGGQWQENAGSYGLAMGAVPSRKIPEVVERITGSYLADRQGEESFQDYIRRIGKAQCKKMLEDLTVVPTYEEDSTYYSDWGDPRVFTTGDMGVGECAGEVVAPIDFQLTAAEREAFEAQLHLESGRTGKAVNTAYGSMIHAAHALLRFHGTDPESNGSAGSGNNDGNDHVVDAFRREFFDTELFFDPYARGKFGAYLFKAQGRSHADYTAETAHQLIEEAYLFIEASHACYARLAELQAATA
jgi:sulfite reductase (ferredoxin)